MDIPAQQEPPLGLITLGFFAVGVCLVIWSVIIERLFSGTPILPYQPRRRVPWKLLDLLAVLCFIFFLSFAVFNVAQYFFGLEINESPDKPVIGKKSIDHPIVQLIAARNWVAIILGGFVGIVIAPII